jgi:hypothetical protein
LDPRIHSSDGSVRTAIRVCHEKHQHPRDFRDTEFVRVPVASCELVNLLDFADEPTDLFEAALAA